MQQFDGARLSPNSVRNAVWRALNEPVCRYLRTRNLRCSTVYIDNILGPLARDSPCITNQEFLSFIVMVLINFMLLDFKVNNNIHFYIHPRNTLLMTVLFKVGSWEIWISTNTCHRFRKTLIKCWSFCVFSWLFLSTCFYINNKLWARGDI